MIFVTLGNHPQPFYRLLKKVDQLAEDKVVDDVFVQVGYSDYQPKYCTYKKFVGFNKFIDLIKKSDLVISHAGAGTIQNVLLCGKPIIVVPRLKKYGEHINDHQLEITGAMEAENKVIAVYDVEKIAEAITKAGILNPMKLNISHGIAELIEDYLEKMRISSKG